MIVSADSRILTNYGYLRTKDYRLAPLSLPSPKGLFNHVIYCKSTQDTELTEYHTDLGYRLVTNRRFENGSHIDIQRSTFLSGVLNDVDLGTIFGLASRAVISEKERCVLIHCNKDRKQIEEVISSKIKDNKSVELFIPNEFHTGGSHLFDYIASFEPSPAVLNYCVPETIFSGTYETVKAYLAALARSTCNRSIDHQYAQVFDLPNNLFARQVQILLLNCGINTKIIDDKNIAMTMFDFSIFLGKIGIFGHSHEQSDKIFAFYDRAVAEPSPSFATIVSAIKSERLACSEVISEDSVIINGLIINLN